MSTARRLLVFGLVLWMLGGIAGATDQGATQATSAVVKAAFLFNFVKFTEWPAIPAKAPIAVCVAGDDEVADALETTLQRQVVAGHPLNLRRSGAPDGWPSCHLLFVGDALSRKSAPQLADIENLPVLTVSDTPRFARGSGIVELFVQDNRMRFAINVGAAERAGLRISSRLLSLAQVVEDGRVE